MGESHKSRSASKNWLRWAGAASVTALMASFPGMAMAQSSQDAQNQPALTDEVVVTGIRAGLATSIAAKREETSIVEVVSAEDIGKLPDVSIAESLARLPGLAGQRVNGRAQVISIRGLSPDFTTTLLNGRQQASSGDNRAVEFDQYPSELLSSVMVYKTPDASISGFGLSGTADLRTVRPLEFGERAFAVNVRAEGTDSDQLNDDVSTFGGRVSLSYIDQFANDTIGVAIGYAHLDSPSQNRHYKSYSYESFGFAVTPNSADPALLVNGQEAFAYSRENVRDAVIGIVEWEPSDKLHSTLDLYYSTFSQRETMRGAQWFSNGWADGATFTNVQTTTVGGTPFGYAGTLNRGVPIIRNDYNKRDDELIAAGLNTEYDFSDNVRLVTDLSYSKNTRDEQVLETYAGYGLGVGGVTGSTQNVGRTFDTITFNHPVEGFPTYTTGLNYADATQVSLGDRAPWGGWGHDGAIRLPHVEESIAAADVALQFDLDGIFNHIEVGVNWTSREKSKVVPEYDLMLNGANRQQVLVDPRYLVAPTSLSFAGLGSVLSVNLPAAMGAYYTLRPILDRSNFDKAWDLSEDVITGYTKFSFQGGPWRGNVGFQLVHQDQQSTGVRIQPASAAPGAPIVGTKITDGASYVDMLPSLNLIYDIGGGHRVRFASAYTMARPRIDELRANLTANYSVPGSGTPGTTVRPWSASGGNPQLEPWRATAFDLAYEWYADKTSYFSVALFHKELDSYIYTQSVLTDFSSIPIPSGSAALPPGTIYSPVGPLSMPVNGNGGSVSGFEVSGAIDFGLVVPSLEGLGLMGSYSQTDSDLNPTSGTNTVRIAGLSGEVLNLTGYYERGGFQARASYRWRSAFKGEVVQLFANRGFTEVLDDEQLDAQIGYTFQQGPFEGLGVLLQVNNLTDSPYRTRIGLDTGGAHTLDGGTLQEVYEEYGRQIMLGVNYRF
ncbi:MAG: TonB-dependent receptor [Caulobacteraceae bacterium]|nr:MAG: TonB-dependent receptor [Caulobacteraceae bacterium]